VVSISRDATVGVLFFFFASKAVGARGGGGLQPDVAARPLDRTRDMRTRRGECIQTIEGPLLSIVPIEIMERGLRNKDTITTKNNICRNLKNTPQPAW